MSNMFWKIFHLCFAKLKSADESPLVLPPPSPTKQDDNIHTTTYSSTPLATSLHQQHFPSRTSTPFTTSSTTLLLKNFNFLYDLSSSSASTSKSLLTPSTHTDSDSDDADSPPDFATIFASHRFFFSSPGRSNSIIQSPDTRPEAESSNTETETPLLDGGVAVKKYSPDPYKDFRFSMQEMIEARNLTDVKKDWEFLHELLLCYLTLNPKNTHKFIVSAFADIVVCLLSSSSPESDSHRRPVNHRR